MVAGQAGFPNIGHGKCADMRHIAAIRGQAGLAPTTQLILYKYQIVAKFSASPALTRKAIGKRGCQH
jgi:hypothetical protein